VVVTTIQGPDELFASAAEGGQCSRSWAKVASRYHAARLRGSGEGESNGNDWEPASTEQKYEISSAGVTEVTKATVGRFNLAQFEAANL